MGAYRFVTTRLRGLHAAGRADDLQHALISALLARHLGPEYSGLFAEFEVRDNDTRDWFVEALPAPVPIASLPEDDQHAIRSRADQMIAAVRDLAARIEIGLHISTSPFLPATAGADFHSPTEGSSC